MSYNNKWEENGLLRDFTGHITGQEVLNSNLSMHGDARFYNIKYIINDFTQIETFEVTDIDIAEIVVIDNVAALSKHQLKIIIVATDETLLKWINLYIKKMENSPFECVIFNNVKDAYQSIH